MGNRVSSTVVGAQTRGSVAAAALHRHRGRLERSPLARRVTLRRLGWWALAAVVAWTVADQVATAQAAEATWGRTVAVVVATSDLSPGDVIAEDSVTVEQVPARFVPGAALDALPSGRRVNASLAAGEMVLSTRLAPAGLGRTGAALPDGSRAVTIGLGEAAAPVRAGDVVDLLAVTVGGDTGAVPDLYEDTGPVVARRVAARAIVLGVSATAATLAVRAEEVRPTVAAAATQQLSLVITG